jgi:hypothetical protein
MTIRAQQTPDGIVVKLQYRGFSIHIALDNFEGVYNEYTHPHLKVFNSLGQNVSSYFSYKLTGRAVDAEGLCQLFQEIDYFVVKCNGA